MNVNETLQIIQALKACGAVHFKSQDFEISLGASHSREQLPIPPQTVEPAQAQPLPSVSGTPAAQFFNQEATEKAQNLINTLKLTPEALLDQIMPAGAGG